MSVRIWEPVHFDDRWNNVKTVKFDNLRPSWDKRRIELSKNQDQYKEFIDKLKRKQAIDTGIIESLYDLKRGVTATLIEKGFSDSYLHHGDTNIDKELLMDHLKDNLTAIEFIFDFVGSKRELSISYIKELHCLVTMHQDTIDAIDNFGTPGKVPLLKGVFKKMPNNPQRSDGTIYEYCPVLQVDSEMDNLIRIFNNEINDTHILVRTAFLHHAFSQIHPFQDGNGRMARLLASFVLIKDNLFPFSLEREDRDKYLDALADADRGNYQNLVDVIADNQIKSIQEALNLETVKTDSIQNILEVLNTRIANKKTTAQQDIVNNMHTIFELIKEQVQFYENDLVSKLGETVNIEMVSCDPLGEKENLYSYQIAQYAKDRKYYFNSSLSRCWTRIRISFDDTHRYQLVLSLHHFGYDNSTFAIGFFINKQQPGEAQELLVLLPIDPLVFSSEREIDTIRNSICDYIKDIFTAVLAYIAEEFA